MHAVLERVVSQIASEVRHLDADAAQLHPKGLAYKWNAQEVIEHLVLGCRLTTSALETRLNKGRVSRNQNRTYLQWSLQFMILTFGALPRGVPALEETMPTPGRFPAMSGRQLSDLLRQEIEAMDTVLDACRRRFGMERVGNASMAWTATGGSVAALSRGAWTPPRTPAAVGDGTGGPGPCPAETEQRESSGKIACTSPTSIGLERRCRFQPD